MVEANGKSESRGCANGPMRDRRPAAYLGDHRAVGGIGPLLRQKLAAERFAVIRWSSPHLRLFIDSGRPDGSPDWSRGMDLLLAAVRAGVVKDVIIANVNVLAPTQRGARRAATALRAAGAVIHQLSGHGRAAAYRKSERDAGK